MKLTKPGDLGGGRSTTSGVMQSGFAAYAPVLGGQSPVTMTRAQTALGYASILLAGWIAVALLAEPVLDIAVDTHTALSPAEESIISVYLFVIRYIPFLIVPALLAPSAVVLRWLISPTRPTVFQPKEREREHLARWLWWVAAVVVVVASGAWANHLREGVVPVGVWMWALMAFSWAYAGALDRAFRVHSLRKDAGDTKIGVQVVVLAGAATLVAEAVGPLLPLWVFWASRTPSAAQQRHAPDGAQS